MGLLLQPPALPTSLVRLFTLSVNNLNNISFLLTAHLIFCALLNFPSIIMIDFFLLFGKQFFPNFHIFLIFVYFSHFFTYPKRLIRQKKKGRYCFQRIPAYIVLPFYSFSQALTPCFFSHQTTTTAAIAYNDIQIQQYTLGAR